MKVKIILTFLLVFVLASFVSASCTTEDLTEKIIIEKMIWNIPELSDYTFGGVQEHCDIWEGYDLRYKSPADNDQHSEFWLREYKTEQEANSTFYSYFNPTPPYQITTKIINGNTLLEQTIETEPQYRSYIWISGKNILVSWNGNDIGTIYDDFLMNLLAERYLEKYPSTYRFQINQITEQVTCVFTNSDEIQKCYTIDNHFYCSSTSEQQSCRINIFGSEDEELGWMSSCGTYNITIVDGIDKTIEFDCSVSRQENVPGFGYAYAFYECYDGTFGQIQATPSCKSYDSWQSFANNLCEDRCGLTEVEIGKGIYENQTKCGAKGVGVTQECQQGLLDRLFNWFKRLFGAD